MFTREWPWFWRKCWAGGNIDHVLVGNVGTLKLSSTVYFSLSALCKGCLSLSFSLLILLDLSLGSMRWWRRREFLSESWVRRFIFGPGLHLTWRDSSFGCSGSFRHSNSRVWRIEFLPADFKSWYVPILNA